MAEYIKSKEKIGNVGETLFENKTDSAFEVSAGIVFRENGIYTVSVSDGHISVEKKSEGSDPQKKPKKKDSVDRQAVIDAINTWDKFGVDERNRIVRWREGLEPYVHLRDVMTAIVNLPSVQTETDKQELIRTITTGIAATNTKDVYSCGMRNGMRWCKALLEEDAPKFEECIQPEQPKDYNPCDGCKGFCDLCPAWPYMKSQEGNE